ncbi:hypothetical protein Zmor_008750 [Zophobas morio]|jgi:hypothetical protein|uniref:Uncharacterized protein n=1 Tax=Zophobas morio TaxID=2755281 RepID=A0AA38HK21_9CUCU|nr:hypothetical protein Zmor_008750 [Zophobas morio]
MVFEGYFKGDEDKWRSFFDHFLIISACLQLGLLLLQKQGIICSFNCCPATANEIAVIVSVFLRKVLGLDEVTKDAKKLSQPVINRLICFGNLSFSLVLLIALYCGTASSHTMPWQFLFVFIGRRLHYLDPPALVQFLQVYKTLLTGVIYNYLIALI